MSSLQVDQEASSVPKEFLDGYVDFAEFIASDGQLSIFRQFRSLAARNLLYLEAELQLLQFEIQAIDDADQALLNNVDEQKSKTEEAIRAWECFKQQTQTDTRQAQKLEMIMKLRRLMKEYGMFIREKRYTASVPTRNKNSHAHRVQKKRSFGEARSLHLRSHIAVALEPSKTGFETKSHSEEAVGTF